MANPSSLVPTLSSGLHEVPVNAIGSQSSSSTVTTDLLASTVVQGSLVDVSAAVTDLVPSTSEGPPPVPGQCFQSVSLPVDARVSEKLWGKIWKDEFIDFGSLLANPVLANRFQLTVQNAESGPLPSLCIEPIAKSKKITSFESWLSSFHIFVGIYTKRFPHEAPALMKYCGTIQDLAGRGHKCKYYDENFRFLRQAHHSALPWDRIHDELWLKSHQVLQARSLQPTSQVQLPDGADTTPKGYCFRFHKGRKCAPACAYKHLCYKCEGSHPVPKCNFRGPAKTPVSPSPPNLPTPVRVARLGFLLEGYTHYTVEFLISGFTHGFPIHFQGERKSRTANNLLSALDNPMAVDAKIRKELEAQQLAGPFQSPPLSPFWVSPLGVVPKKAPGEFRLIHHLSFPKGSSVNDGIPPEHTSVHYATIDGAIKLIKSAGPGCFLAKTDIKNAF